MYTVELGREITQLSINMNVLPPWVTASILISSILASRINSLGIPPRYLPRHQPFPLIRFGHIGSVRFPINR